MAYSGAAADVNAMFGSIAGRYDLTNTVLSFGTHHLWRRTLLGLTPPDPKARALDLCTGTADLVPPLKRRFGPVTGADFCLPMLQVGQRKLAPGARERLVQSDALNLPFADGSFDVVTVAFGVRNFENLEKGLSEIRRVLAPGGRLLVLEFGQPDGAIFGPLFKLYSDHIMPLIGGLLTGNRAAYQYLPRTAGSFPCREAFMQILSDCGYAPKRCRALTFGIAFAYLAERV